jgi:hypothetical protein
MEARSSNGGFMSMVTGGEWGKVKRRHPDMADVKRKE